MHPFADLEVAKDSVAIHWFGQSSFALKNAAGTVVQLDPYFPRQRPPEQFIHARPPLDESTLPTDFVLLTHHHGDHTCLESLLRIRAAFPQTVYIGPPESTAALLAAGIPADRALTVTAGTAVGAGSMRVEAVWSKPPGGIPADRIAAPDVQHLGYVVDTGPVRVYVTGDLVSTFAEHEALVAPVRALAPEVGLLTTHPDEGEFPDLDGAARLASRVGLAVAVPSHYGCFVQRTFHPDDFAARLVGVQGLAIPYNQSIVYATRRPARG